MKQTQTKHINVIIGNKYNTNKVQRKTTKYGKRSRPVFCIIPPPSKTIRRIRINNKQKQKNRKLQHKKTSKQTTTINKNKQTKTANESKKKQRPAPQASAMKRDAPLLCCRMVTYFLALFCGGGGYFFT